MFHPSFLLASFQPQPPVNPSNHLDPCIISDIMGTCNGTFLSLCTVGGFLSVGMVSEKFNDGLDGCHNPYLYLYLYAST